MTFAREALDSEQFQAMIESIRRSVLQQGGLKLDEWREEDTTILYELGFNLYRTRFFEKAEAVFRKLVVVMPLEKNHWQGLASAIQMQNRPEEALSAWSMYAFIDPKSPLPHYYAAECLFNMKDYPDCLKALEALKERDLNSEFETKASAIKASCLEALELSHA